MAGEIKAENLLDLMLLPDLDQAAVYEIKIQHGSPAIPAYCTRCEMNWANLITEDDDRADETYLVCPACRNDFFLQDPKPGPAYVFKRFQGILNIATGEPYIKPAPAGQIYIPEIPFDREAWRLKKEAEEQILDDAIQAYTYAIDAGAGQEAAKLRYFEILSTIN